MSDNEQLKDRPVATAFTEYEGGTWQPWAPGSDISRVHALRFADGSVWDTYNGWRLVDIAAMKRQNQEFDALENLIAAYQAHKAVTVVDDDYPEVRHNYETMLAAFIAAYRANRPLEF